MKKETEAWLIEKSMEGKAFWFSHDWTWTDDAYDAIWFVRKKDAESTCSMFGFSDEGAFITDHVFG